MLGMTMRGLPRACGAWLLVAALLLLGMPLLQAAEAGPARQALAAASASDTDDDGLARVIVKYRSGSTLAVEAAGAPRHAGRLGRQLGLDMEDRHVLGRRTQSLRARGIGSAALAAKLAARADVEWAVPVRRKTLAATVPNDPYFGAGQTGITPAVGQWYLRAPDSTAVSAVNALGAWAITEGSASVVVAVLDTGVRLDHPDLAGKLKPGYDFIATTSTAADGGGRDADPNDPGDYNPTARTSCAVSNSSWHGTQVAGLIGAATDNGIGMAGTGRNTMVLPVRVLGRCGGFDDDIQAGMRWAAGLSNAATCSGASVVSATCNPNPAKVINLSLGSVGTCSTAYHTLIAELNTAGVSVVVAAGNKNGLAVNEPANCDGAIAVAGIRHAGTKVGYSNLGPEISIAAPAGNCVNETGTCLYPLLTTDNDGSTTPGTNTYSSGSLPSLGTSFAAPIVAGTAALMLAANPALTPAQVRTMLRSAARAFPATGALEAGTVACQSPSAIEQVECYCTTSTCGAGMLDAQAAVILAAGSVAPPTAALAPAFGTVLVGGQLTLSGSGSAANGGRSIGGYNWALVGSNGIASLSSSSGSSVVLTALAAGSLTVQLTVTDSAGAIGTANSSITVQAIAAPAASFSASPTSPTVGSNATLDAAGSSVLGGRSITGYQWQITAGTGIASFSSGTTGSTAVLTTSGAGTVTVALTVTDSAGATGTVSQTITVAAAPVVVTNSGSSGGGGALAADWLLGLMAAVLLLWRGRPGRRGAGA